MTPAPHRKRPLPRLALGGLLLLAVGCRASLPRPSGVPARYDSAEVPEALLEGRAALETGETWAAVAILSAAQAAPDLDGATRGEVQTLLIQAVGQRIEELRSEPEGAEQLEVLAELEVPRDLAVRASLAAARSWLEAGERFQCHETLVAMDERYPLHARRMEAGELQFQAGISLAEDPGKYALVFSYSTDGITVLESFIERHPGHPSGPRAYEALVEAYEEDRLFDLAIRRAEGLLLEYPGTAEGTWAQAQIPHLRLASLGSPEYDRGLMLQARAELAEWLETFPGHPLEEQVRIDLADALQRLADSDLSIARFYRKVQSAAGFEFHARRALDTAREAGNEAQITEAEALLAQASEALEAAP